mmetsp:Transcript_4453/g.8681  ORF Transcript_4453/g.8681 Transcript_4453/m.8681 type:complete len:373 (+) Transcript_4453:993-2111(+)
MTKASLARAGPETQDHAGPGWKKCTVRVIVIIVCIAEYCRGGTTVGLVTGSRSARLVSSVTGMGTAMVPRNSPPPSFPQHCSCDGPWNESITAVERMQCCRRSVVSAHKMGWQMLIKINRQHLARIPGGQVRMGHLYSVEHITVEPRSRGSQYDMLMNQTLEPHQDFRTVFVTRNWYDTLISGYLYHRSGRECFLSSGGKYGFSGWLMRFDWQQYITEARGDDTHYWPPPRVAGECLCKYLDAVSEVDGMRVYVDVALELWLRPLLTLANAFRNGSPFTSERVLLLCYHEFNNATEFPAAIKATGTFLYPGEEDEQWDGKEKRIQDSGGHATSTDQDMRRNLYNIVKKLDAEYFDNEIRTGSDAFGCRSDTL